MTACNLKNEIDSNYFCKKLEFNCTQENLVINFKTSKGNFEVELFGKDKPVTVSNFLENIENNIYVNQKFYKIINFPEISFIHGGVNPKNKFYIDGYQTLKKTSPSIPLEIKFKEEIKPRYNYQIKNPSEIENLVNTFEAGSIAMVKRSKNSLPLLNFFLLRVRFQN